MSPDEKLAQLEAQVERLTAERDGAEFIKNMAEAGYVKEQTRRVEAEARAEAAEAAAWRVRALHDECTEWADDGEPVVVPPFCVHCMQPWPCPTVAALSSNPLASASKDHEGEPTKEDT